MSKEAGLLKVGQKQLLSNETKHFVVWFQSVSILRVSHCTPTPPKRRT